jgi:hypothetical protein
MKAHVIFFGLVVLALVAALVVSACGGKLFPSATIQRNLVRLAKGMRRGPIRVRRRIYCTRNRRSKIQC